MDFHNKAQHGEAATNESLPPGRQDARKGSARSFSVLGVLASWRSKPGCVRPRYRLLILASLVSLASAEADVIYSGLQNIAIALGFDGTTVNIDTGAQVPADSTGWDINAFFGGAGVANSPSFQPVRIGTGNQDQILRLNTGDVIDASRYYSSGYGGSDSHLGAGATQFQPGQEAYLGFKFFTDANAGPYFGWARVVFTANQPGGVIKDFAYDTTASSIAAGRVLQGPATGGQQTMTLSGALGETYTLSAPITDVGGNVNSLLKTGAGTWKLTGNNTYTGSTTIAGGLLELGTGAKLSQTASVAVQTTGTLLLSGTGGRTRSSTPWPTSPSPAAPSNSPPRPTSTNKSAPSRSAPTRPSTSAPWPVATPSASATAPACSGPPAPS